jgi:Arc/MetJ-type ribon-helix-helix transcriptional regulator
MSRYRTVKLPEPMVKAIEKILKEHPECGWQSTSEFVRDAIRYSLYWKQKYAK